MVPPPTGLRPQGRGAVRRRMWSEPETPVARPWRGARPQSRQQRRGPSAPFGRAPRNTPTRTSSPPSSRRRAWQRRTNRASANQESEIARIAATGKFANRAPAPHFITSRKSTIVAGHACRTIDFCLVRTRDFAVTTVPGRPYLRPPWRPRERAQPTATAATSEQSFEPRASRRRSHCGIHESPRGTHGWRESS